MKKIVYDTTIPIVKADTASVYEDTIMYIENKDMFLEEEVSDLVTIVTKSLITTNSLEIDSIEVYTSNVIKMFKDRNHNDIYKLSFYPMYNVLILEKVRDVLHEEVKILKALVVFMLPIFLDSKKSKVIKITTGDDDDDDDKITGNTDLILVSLPEDIESEAPKDTKVDFHGIQDRRIYRERKTLVDAINYSHIINDGDKARSIEAKKISRVLEKYIMGISGMSTTTTPKKRMHRRKIFSDTVPDIYVTKKGLDDYGEFERRANIILDCSGSMGGIFDQSKLLAEAVSLIRNIKGKIILSAGKGSIDFSMPVDHAIISSFVCLSESEGLAATMIKYEKDILKADVTIVFTDGNIVDGIPTQEFKDKHKDKLVGALISESDYASIAIKTSLRRHFSRVMVAQNAMQLVDLIMARGELSE